MLWLVGIPALGSFLPTFCMFVWICSKALHTMQTQKNNPNTQSPQTLSSMPTQHTQQLHTRTHTHTTAAFNINKRSANPLRNSSRPALHTLEQPTSCQTYQPPRSVIVIQLTLRVINNTVHTPDPLKCNSCFGQSVISILSPKACNKH